MTDLEKAAAQAAQSDVAAAGLDPAKKRAKAPYAGKEPRKNGAGRSNDGPEADGFIGGEHPDGEVLSDPVPDDGLTLPE